MIYKDNYLKEISFPLGGIGSGSIGLTGNGTFLDWEIFNRPSKNSNNQLSHFAVRAIGSDNDVVDARVLCGDCVRNYSGTNDYFGHGMSVSSMNGFPHFEKNTFNGEFPFAELEFYDKKFPGNVKLTAFNPLIPLDSKNSSIPAAFFEVEFENISDSTLKYEAVFSVANPFRSSINEASSNGVIMYDATNKNNNLSVLTPCENSHITDYWYRGWACSFYKDNIRKFWDDFVSGKELVCRNYENKSSYDVCSVSADITLSPGEKNSVKFILSWSIPENYNYWFPLKKEDGSDVTWKNYYATIFSDSKESAEYCIKNWDYLYLESEKFRKALYSCTLPESFKSAIQTGLSVLKSPTVLRLEDGSLYGFEGVSVTKGSCEGLCQHVWNYAYVCCYLFPDLEMGIRDNEFKYGVLETGETVFRLPLPFYRKEFVNLFTNDGSKFIPCVDGQMGDIIKAYREWKFSGDSEWLKNHWKTIKKVLDFAFSPENQQCWDENGDGVLEGSQHHTLDIEIFGTSAWLEGFYLAALKCAAEMAEFLGDNTAFEKYVKLFKKGYEYTKNELFNGEYFIQKVDLKNKEISDKFGRSNIFWNVENAEIAYQILDGCFIDQLCAQWHSILCGFENVFDNEQAKKAVLSIYKNNYKASMRDFVNPWRLFAVNDEGGTVMCTYPEGAKKPAVPIAYCEEVMSGFEYSFAALLVHYGYLDEAINVVSSVRERYNGQNRNPYNDIECGNNYARSMAAFSLIPILSGFVPDLTECKLRFEPKVNKYPFKSVWFTNTGWGEFELNQDEIIINVKNGYVDIKTLEIPFANDVKSLKVNNETYDYVFQNGAVSFDKVRLCDKLIVSMN